MIKEFDKWNQKKKQANVDVPRLYTVREVWWCRLGVNIGTEQDGSGDNFLRPIIILRGFSSDACLVLPLTASTNRHPLRIPIGKIQDKEASAIVSQIRVIDTRRLVEKVGFLDKKTFGELRKAVRSLF